MKKIILPILFLYIYLPQEIFASNIPGVQTPIIINPQGLGNCPTSYYTYQQPLRADAPTLADLFDGKAHFQNIAESQIVNLQFNPSEIDTGYANGQPSKLPILFNSSDGKYYTYSRAYSRGADIFNIYLMSSTDGVNFTQVSGPVLEQTMKWLYDGHISIDYSVCPNQYIMALECNGNMCMSDTSTPFDPASWSKSVEIVSWGGYGSASTGVFLIDGYNKYASWTVVDDGGALGG